MIAIDTNLVVRLLTGDDKLQFNKTLALFEAEDIYITETVILESEWVLRHAYGFSREAIGIALGKLCGLPSVYLSQPGPMLLAVEWLAQGLDFADALHLALSQESERFYTFDAKFARKAKGLGKPPVLQP